MLRPGGTRRGRTFRVTAEESSSLDMDTLVEALDALGDGIAIYDSHANPIFTNEISRRRFARMYADVDAGMTYRQSIEATVKRLMPDALPEEVERLTSHFENKFHSGETYAS